MATTLVRGSNPVWSYVDLTGKQFDDTFYMWVLQNDIPYFPAIVWHDPAGNVQWTNPIQFFANGTLPIDSYWDPTAVYRLEFRRHLNPLTPPTQADPLIYLVENYQVGQSGTNPGTLGIATENQISNPQFEAVFFASPFVLTTVSDQVLEIAPDWILTTVGTGNITIERTPLNNSLINPTNAPYALHLTLSGFMSATLAQRFNQNGMLWTSTPGHTRFVASSLTARAVASMPAISAQIVDSDGNTLGTVLTTTILSGSFNEYPGTGQMAATTNTDVPPDAWIEYQLLLPGTIDVYLTSFQLIQTESAAQLTYIEDSIERQIDHLFHHYKPGLDLKPISSYLVGWDFPLNPSQFYGTPTNGTVPAQAIGANAAYYAWDQTIIFQTANSGVSVSRLVKDGSLHLTAEANGQLAIIQYLIGNQARGLFVSAILNAVSAYVAVASLPVKSFTISLWWSTNASLPSVGAGDVFFATLDADGHPTTITAGWHELSRLHIGESNKFSNVNGSIIEQFNFPAFFDGAPEVAQADKFAIVIGTTALTTGNVVIFQSVSVVPGVIPTPPAPQTPDEVLRECQYYYQKSFFPDTAPKQAAGVNSGESFGVMASTGAGTVGPIVRFPVPMINAPIVTLFNPNAFNDQIFTLAVGDWSVSSASAFTSITRNGFITSGTSAGIVGNISSVHWTADAVLGSF